MNMRTIPSLTLLNSFVLLVLTSIILYIIRELGKQNIKAAPEKTIKKIAADNKMDPHAFFGVLHNAAVQ